MKLFFAVLFVILATGFISFMTLSLYQVEKKHPEKFENLQQTNSAPALPAH